MKNLILFWSSLFLALQSLGQSQVISGRVLDARTKKPLAFVAVSNVDEQKGTQTDIDGKFIIKAQARQVNLRLQYVGYEGINFMAKADEQNIVYLSPKTNAIAEVQVFAGENPAHRIINAVINNKSKNNPDELSSYQFMSYNKFYFSGKRDTALEARDSISRTKLQIAKLDTSNKDEFARKKDSIMKAYARSVMRSDSIFEQQYIFMTETVTEKKYLKPNQSKEEVKALRVSGLKNPQFTLIASQFQSFSFYNDYLNVLDKKYLNPISKGSTSRYFFNIEDTLYQDQDSIFVIAFKPRSGKNFDGLKGLLYIHTAGYAVQNVIAEPFEQSKYFYIKIQQHYERQGEVWFPIQLNTDLEFYGIQLNNRKAYGVGRTYIKDIVIGDELRKKEFSGVVLDFDKRSIKANSDSLLNKYRIDTLDQRELQTYKVIDSVGQAENLDQKIWIATTVANGHIPLGPYFRFDLNRILAFNDFEGFRLGAGFSTSEKLSRIFTLNGYFAYGTKDAEFKYGGGLRTLIYEPKDVDFVITWQHDVIESGSTIYRNDKITPQDKLRNLLVSNMDYQEGLEARINFRSNRYLLHSFYSSYYQRQATNSYQFLDQGNFISDYFVQEIGFSTRWSFREEFMKQAGRKISLGGKFPVVFFNVSNLQGIDGSWRGSIMKYDAKLTKTFTIRNAGQLHMQLHGGLIDGSAPYSFAYNGRANYNGHFSLVSRGYFETMYMNEFLSDQYVSLFLTHDFRKLLFKAKHFQPGLAISTAMGYGSLSNQTQHTGTTLKTMEKGYFEAGLSISDLFVMKSNLYNSGLGIGAYYRMGAYQMTNQIDNLALKLNFNISF